MLVISSVTVIFFAVSKTINQECPAKIWMRVSRETSSREEVQYFIDSKTCKHVELKFLPTGRTIFSPNRLFGVFKSKFADTNTDCFTDAVKYVTQSSCKGLNVPTRFQRAYRILERF